MKRGLYIGRFQPFHLGHLNDVKNALKEVDELIIGIGSGNEVDTKQNPFSVKERVEMIASVFMANNIRKYIVFTIPDFHDDGKWAEHVESLVPKFEIVYTGNEWTERCFRKKGYKIVNVELLKGISSTIIRQKIVKDKEWKQLVPKEVSEYISKIQGVERIKRINS